MLIEMPQCNAQNTAIYLTTSRLVGQLVGGVVASRVAAATVVAAARHEPHLPRDGEEVVAAVDLVGEEVGRRRGHG